MVIKINIIFMKNCFKKIYETLQRKTLDNDSIYARVCVCMCIILIQ